MVCVLRRFRGFLWLGCNANNEWNCGVVGCNWNNDAGNSNWNYAARPHSSHLTSKDASGP